AFISAKKSVTLKSKFIASLEPVTFISDRAAIDSVLRELTYPVPSAFIPDSEPDTLALSVEACAVPVLCMFRKSRPVKFAKLEVSPVTLFNIDEESVVAPATNSSNDLVPERLSASISAEDSLSIFEVSVVTLFFISLESDVTPSFISDEFFLDASDIAPVAVATFSDIASVSEDTFSLDSSDFIPMKSNTSPTNSLRVSNTLTTASHISSSILTTWSLIPVHAPSQSP